METSLHWIRAVVGDTHQVNRRNLHRLVGELFPPGERAYLYRIECGRDKMAQLLVQSDQEPLVTPSNICVRIVGVKSGVPLLRDGDRFRFRLAALAEKECSKTGKRVHLLRQEAQVAWLRRKLEGDPQKNLPGCAKLLDARVTGFETVYSAKDGEQGYSIPITTFEGVLVVTDSNRAGHVLRKGIGRSKMLGCGLLSLARA